MIVFYIKSIVDKQAIIEDEEYVHCCKVLRNKVGDTIHITDGKGLSGTATIESISKKSAAISIQSTTQHTQSPHQYTIAIAPPKNRSRWEWFVEKSVEIGVTKIIPLKTKNSERAKINIERSQKIIRSAAIQSLRHHHPLISDTMTLDQLLEYGQSYDGRYTAHYKPEHKHLLDCQKDQLSSIIIIGPEGDFTENELQATVNHKFSAVNISKNRLRTETAGIVAITQLVSKA